MKNATSISYIMNNAHLISSTFNQYFMNFQYLMKYARDYFGLGAKYNNSLSASDKLFNGNCL